MTETTLEIDLSVLDDHEFTVPCEYSGHMTMHVPEDPGKFYIRVETACGCSPQYIMCESGYEHLSSRPSLNCLEHGTGHEFRIIILDLIK